MREKSLNYYNMLKEEKNPEATRQFEEIWIEHHDPDIRERKRRDYLPKSMQDATRAGLSGWRDLFGT